MSKQYIKIAEAIAYLQKHIQDQPDLNQVADHVNLSPFHFQKLFTEWAGVSPKQFLQYLSIEYAKNILLTTSSTLFDTAHETGLSSTSRLHDLFVTIEGMTPGEYKNGGKNLMIQYSIQECIFGRYLIASTTKGVCQLSFFDENESDMIAELHKNWYSASIKPGTDIFQEKIIHFFKKGHSTEQIKLHLKGTFFQLKVWEALLKIPEGCLCSYQKIAGHIDKPKASRAVGSAIGSNPVAYIVPCHRVIKNMGIIGEYRWGSIRKKAMIAREASQKTYKLTIN